jgi:hypothetical protein
MTYRALTVLTVEPLARASIPARGDWAAEILAEPVTFRDIV